MRIEQTLHGYADGHRLLATSTELSRSARYVMLGLSDLSGRSMLSGFEEYLTGYPVPGSRLFAFAKTWYAPEMERPGCVWTHTLLIEWKDLVEVQEPGEFRHLFRRPGIDANPWSLEAYHVPLEFAERPAARAPLRPELWKDAHLTLQAVYGIPDAPVFLLADDSRCLEDLVLAVWGQQWPSLRARFRFCTGSIGNRSAEEQPFDLQVIPRASSREVRREVAGATIIAGGDWPPLPQNPDWVGAAMVDLIRPDNWHFRRHLRMYAISGFDGKEAFEPLAELFLMGWESLEGTTLTSLLDRLGNRFPEPATAAGLKAAVAGKSGPLARQLFPAVSDADVLRALATTKAKAAFDLDQLGVEERCRALWQQDRASAAELVSFLIRNEHNTNGERILTSFLRGMTVDDAVELSPSIPALLITLVRLIPTTATSSIVWCGSADRQRELFDAVTVGRDTPEDLQRGIVLAMLQAKSDAVAERAVRKFGHSSVSTILRWFDESGLESPTDLSDGWRRAIADRASDMLDWLATCREAREASAALVADLANPHSMQVHFRGVDLWLIPTQGVGSALPEEARVRFHVFLLALGFDNPPGPADELVVRSFATVHQAIAVDILSYDSWLLLEDQVPRLSWAKNWDKCERLRRGLAQRFALNEWPISQFFRCAKDKKMLAQMLMSCEKIDGSERLFRRIRQGLWNDSFRLDSEERELVEWYV